MGRSVLFLFLDGVGLGDDNPQANPFAQESMPYLEGLLDGHKLLADGYYTTGKPVIVNTDKASLLRLDASMGVDGLPQSASGQAALLTGKNVPAWLGEHEGPKPTQPIIELIRQGTIFSQIRQLGKTASLLNAFPPRYFEAIDREYRLPGVIALAARQAGIQLKTKDDLCRGQALSVDFSGEGWRDHLGYPDTPILSFEQAGKQLRELADQADLALFEYWLTDVAGHHQDLHEALTILKALDTVLGSLVGAWDNEQGLIILTSDHGNMEDMRTRHHTRNDVPLLLVGTQKSRDDFLNGLKSTCRSDTDLTAIAPAIMEFIR